MPTTHDLPDRRTNNPHRHATAALAAVTAVLVLCLSACTPAFAETEACPNAEIRSQQPYGQQLPDCRAYELVSPVDTNGQDATLTEPAFPSRAAVSGEAVTYSSRGLYGEPAGGGEENQFVSRHGPTGWSTQAVSPLQDPFHTEPLFSFEGDAFDSELTKGVVATNAPLVEGAPGGKHSDEFGLYVSDFAGNDYQFISRGERAYGVSTDLRRVIIVGPNEEILEWADGAHAQVDVSNEGQDLHGAVGEAAPNVTSHQARDYWHSMSSDGSRAYFTTPANLDAPGIEQLFVRLNVGQPQSPIAEPETNGTGTLTAGSHVVTSLIAAQGPVGEQATEGANEIQVDTTVGRFVVGQAIEGSGIAPATTITAVSGSTVTLSKPTTRYLERGSEVFSEGPEPFATGETITGDGVPAGTRVTAIRPGSLTLSNSAASSGTDVALNAGGNCTVATDACTIDVSAAQRLRANSPGRQPARYWGASADGSRVFFSSAADLTEDAYTGPGPSRYAPNLYEYKVPAEAGSPGALRDLTVTESGTGADLLGVVQISEDGSYVYYVAEGKLAEGAAPGKPNLYVSHDGNTPKFVATLDAADVTDWENHEFYPEAEPGPENNTAVVNPSGTRLAFLSDTSLTGYDNQQANSGECGGPNGTCRELFLYNAETETLACASCNPSGARPIGQASLGRHREKASTLYRPRNLLEDGTLFFESNDALVPGATGAHRNVYEYRAGRVDALSDVAGAYDSTFLDAGASGRDVFIATADRLLNAQETGNNIAVYDARVDGGMLEEAAAAPCGSTESCRAPERTQPQALAPTVLPGPGSAPSAVPALAPKRRTETEVRRASLARALHACRRDKHKRKRTACERAARKRYGARASGKAAAAPHRGRLDHDRRADP